MNDTDQSGMHAFEARQRTLRETGCDDGLHCQIMGLVVFCSQGGETENRLG